mgnify:CR=1 FL=1|jgi:hypothetical protein
MGVLQAGVDLNNIVDQQTLLLAFLEGYIDWLDISKCQCRLQVKHFGNG